MKSPREILFEQHQSIGPRLDVIRKNALAHLPTAPAHKAHPDQVSTEVRYSLPELFRSFRWHLVGLSAAWVLAALLNMDPAPAETRIMTTQETPPPRQLLTALRENRRQIVELLDSPALLRQPTPEPPPLAPKRRSEISSANAVA